MSSPSQCVDCEHACGHATDVLKNDFALKPPVAPAGAAERHADATAVLAHMRQLERSGGHDAVRISQVRDEMRSRLIGAAADADVAGGSDGDDDAEKQRRRRELKDLVLDILNEARGAPQLPTTAEAAAEAAEQLKQELDYESAAFKIIVRSSARSPVDPRRVLSTSRSSGSGFMVDAERMLVVTNGHVVRNADAVSVLSALAPRSQVRARVVQVCYDLDIAVVAIDAANARAVWGDRVRPRAFTLCAQQRDMFVHRVDRRHRLANAGTADRAGSGCSGMVVRLQRVFAVGYPLGSSSVQISQGIVSGFEGISDEVVIQTTAPISHGNSGGALLNARGEVVGVTSSGIPSGENIGFAIPAATVRGVLDAFASGRYRLQRVLDVPHLGVAFAPGSSLDASSLPRLIKGTDGAYSFDEAPANGGDDDAAPAAGAAGADMKAVPSGVFVAQLEPLHAFDTPIGGADDGAAGTPIQPFDLVTHFNGFELSNEGVTSERTYPRSISLTMLYRALPFLTEYTVRFWRANVGAFERRYAFAPPLPANDYAVRRFYKEQFVDSARLARENTAFDIEGQVRLVQLSVNLVESAKSFAPWLARYAQAAHRTQPRLVVLADARGALKHLDVVATMDGKRVGTRDDVLDLMRAKAERNERFTLVQTELGSSGVIVKEIERATSGGGGGTDEFMSALAAVVRAARQQKQQAAGSDEDDDNDDNDNDE